MLREKLVLSHKEIEEITQQDIVKYAKRLGWEHHYSDERTKTVILNSPNHDQDMCQLLVISDHMVDKPLRVWDCIRQLADYHEIKYVEVARRTRRCYD